MTTIPQDLRLALRRLAGTPGFTGLAVLTLALGIGAHVGIFSLVNALFLRPLPLPDPDRLVGVSESRDGVGFYPLSFPDYVDFRDASTVFSEVAAHYSGAPLALRTDDGQQEIDGGVVSASYFSLLGVEPARGRFFLPEDDTTPGTHPVAVVSHELWQSRLGGRDDVIGSIVNLNNTEFTVVGVAPAGFAGTRFGFRLDVWMPTMMASVGYRWCDQFERDCRFLNMIGRLEDGVTMAAAQTEMDVISRRVHVSSPLDPPRGTVRGLQVAPLIGVRSSRGGVENLRLAGLLLAAVTLVVVIAGANVSGLLVARGLGRRREIAIRLAIGAARGRVVSLLLTETLLLAAAGGVGGLLVAGWFGRVVAHFYPTGVPLDLSPDPIVIGWAVALSVVTGLLVGAVPAVQAARPNLVPALKDGGMPGGGRRPKLLGTLVVVQVALSFVLVTSTGLLVRSLTHVSGAGSLDPSSVATLRLRPRLVSYSPEQGQAFSREVVRRLEALPGVSSVSLGVGLNGLREIVPVGLPGEPRRGEDDGPTASANQVGPRFFETFGIHLLRGRDFDERDRVGSAPVVVVNQALVRGLWPDGEAVGELLVVEERTFEVVGVVEDAAHLNRLQAPVPQVYLAYWQDPEMVDARVGVRTAGDAAQLVPMLLRTVDAIDPRVPVTEARTLRERLDRFLAPIRLAGRVLGVSGGLALFLSAVGLYGVLALAVTQRRRDIAVRMALGGSRAHIVGLTVRDAMVLVGVALGLGLGVALLVNQTLAHYLYGVSPRDPWTFGAALLVLVLISGVASWWPARRAAEVDPLVALREQ